MGLVRRKMFLGSDSKERAARGHKHVDNLHKGETLRIGGTELPKKTVEEHR